MRVPNAVHEAHPWVIALIAPDFELLDAWALPAEGGSRDFDLFLETMASLDPLRSGSAASRGLFWVRSLLGSLLGWDDQTKDRPIPGSKETALSARLPAVLRGSATTTTIGGTLATAGLVPLYRTDDEWAGEISNDTVHGVLQFAWVEQGDGRYRAHLGVYVKTRGTPGRVYLKLIEPFRRFIVYPALIQQVGRAWESRDRSSRTAPR